MRTEGDGGAGRGAMAGRGADAAVGGAMVLTGLEGKVAVVTGAGRMRSIGRPIAVELAQPAVMS